MDSHYKISSIIIILTYHFISCISCSILVSGLKVSRVMRRLCHTNHNNVSHISAAICHTVTSRPIGWLHTTRLRISGALILHDANYLHIIHSWMRSCHRRETGGKRLYHLDRSVSIPHFHVAKLSRSPSSTWVRVSFIITLLAICR